MSGDALMVKSKAPVGLLHVPEVGVQVSLPLDSFPHEVFACVAVVVGVNQLTCPCQDSSICINGVFQVLRHAVGRQRWRRMLAKNLDSSSALASQSQPW